VKAMAIARFNEKPTAYDLPVPDAREGEVVVDVDHASLNGIDVATWLGYIEKTIPHEFPITLGRDFAGVVAGVGPGVADFGMGDAVFGVQLAMPLHHGTFAEQVVVPVASVAARPPGLGSPAAGALGLAGVAAKLAVDALALTADDTVLICGACGGVGSLAVQLAKATGATVIATAAPDGAAFVGELGADHAVDHRSDLAAAVRRLRPGGVDAALHAAGDPLAIADLVRPGGRFASVLGAGPEQMGDREIAATRVIGVPTSAVLTALAAAVASGGLRVPVTATYGLDDVPQALDHFASGKLGKLGIAVRSAT
jgi:NADPH2:quinone reductase